MTTGLSELKRLAIFLPLAACAPFWLGGLGGDGRTTTARAQDVILAISPRQPAGHIEDLPDQPFLAATAPIVGADSRTPSAIGPADTAAAAKPAAPANAGRSLEPSRPPAPARPAAPPAPAPRPRTRTMRMLVTAYCPCQKCCGSFSDGVTASGKSIYAHGSRFVAADTRVLGFHTRLSIPGYYGGAPVSVLDRGGKIKGNRLDLFFLSHARATKWGARRLNVTVYLD